MKRVLFGGLAGVAIGLASVAVANPLANVSTAPVAQQVAEKSARQQRIAEYVSAAEALEARRTALAAAEALAASAPEQDPADIRLVIGVVAAEVAELERRGETEELAARRATLAALIDAEAEALRAAAAREEARTTIATAQAEYHAALGAAVAALGAATGHAASPDFARRLHRVLSLGAPDPALIDALGEQPVIAAVALLE